MSAPSGADLLHDPAALLAADTGGLVPAAFCAGAQVRSVAGQLAGLRRTDRPRACVVVGPSAAADAAVLTALLGDRVPAPILTGPTLPGWVGPLDLVIVLAGTRDDEPSAQAVGMARHRGAVVHVRGAADGPVATAAEETLLPVELAVPEGLAAPARIALLAGLAATAGLGPDPRLAELADLLDQVTLAGHPQVQALTNPAIELAGYLLGGVGVFIGCDVLADPVAAHASAVFTDIAGLPTTDLPSARAAASPALFGRIADGPGLFEDPFTDDPTAMPASRPVLLAVEPEDPAPGAARRSLLAPLRRALPRGLVWAHTSPTGAGRPAEPESPLARALALIAQLDMAAVYAGLLAGQRLPEDHPRGLGRAGGSHWAVRAADLGRQDGRAGGAGSAGHPDRERYDSWN